MLPRPHFLCSRSLFSLLPARRSAAMKYAYRTLDRSLPIPLPLRFGFPLTQQTKPPGGVCTPQRQRRSTIALLHNHPHQMDTSASRFSRNMEERDSASWLRARAVASGRDRSMVRIAAYAVING